MDEDGFLEINDDHNHNYCEDRGSSYYSNSRSHVSRDSRDTLCFPPVVVGVLEPAENVRKTSFVTESSYLESESSSQSGQCDSSGASASSAGRLILNSPSKFRKFNSLFKIIKQILWYFLHSSC